MNTRRNNARTTEEENFNEAVPPQDPRNPQVPIEVGALYAQITPLLKSISGRNQVENQTRSFGSIPREKWFRLNFNVQLCLFSQVFF